jgi:hypothetical protein
MRPILVSIVMAAVLIGFGSLTLPVKRATLHLGHTNTC